MVRIVQFRARGIGILLDAASIRILVVEDHETWRRFYSTALQKRPELQVIGEVSDGLEGI